MKKYWTMYMQQLNDLQFFENTMLQQKPLEFIQTFFSIIVIENLCRVHNAAGDSFPISTYISRLSWNKVLDYKFIILTIAKLMDFFNDVITKTYYINIPRCIINTSTYSNLIKSRKWS